MGLTVATIGEAEVFADAGFTDLFIAYPVMASGPKAGRLRELAGRCALVRRGGFGRRPRGAGGRDAGERAPRCRRPHRGRLGWSADRRPAGVGGIALARRATDLGLEVSGAFTHEGHGYKGTDLRAAAGEDAADGLAVAAASLRAEGIEPTVLSAGLDADRRALGARRGHRGAARDVRLRRSTAGRPRRTSRPRTRR